MNDKAKIAALRAALERGYKSLASAAMCRTSDGEAAWNHMGEVLALTTDDAEQAPVTLAPFAQIACSACYGTGYGVDGKSCPCGCRPVATPAPIAAEAMPKPWQDSMAEHYGQTDKSICCYGTAHFMQQEIDEWRKK